MATSYIYMNDCAFQVKRNDKKILLHISPSFNLNNYYDKTKLKVSDTFEESPWEGTKTFEVIDPNDTIDIYLPTLRSIPDSEPLFPYFNLSNKRFHGFDIPEGQKYEELWISNHTFVTFKEDIVDKNDERLKSLQKYRV